MSLKKVALLGSTGSIGTQALQIMAALPDEFDVVALSANTNQALLKQQIVQFEPDWAVIGVEPEQELIKVARAAKCELIVGCEKVAGTIQGLKADLVLNALVGYAGFEPSVACLQQGIPLALANKESLVVGGSKLVELQRRNNTPLIPVDSEHSAMLQCLIGEDTDSIRRIIITASGGPFRSHNMEDLHRVTAKQALKHPNWDMGAKITIDSATMMNKGLEIIEAYWLFEKSLEDIVPIIHPQSIIHSIIEFRDGSSKAQLGPPDMRVPIGYALSYPQRSRYLTPVLDWSQSQQMTFEPMDYQKFRCLVLAKEALKAGGLATTVLNAANEIAVDAFLKGRIGFLDIPAWIENALENVDYNQPIALESIQHVDQQTRAFLHK